MRIQDSDASALYSEILLNLLKQEYDDAYENFNDLSFEDKENFAAFIQNTPDKLNNLVRELNNLADNNYTDSQENQVLQIYNQLGLLKIYFKCDRNTLCQAVRDAEPEKIRHLLDIFKNQLTRGYSSYTLSFEDALNMKVKLSDHDDEYSILEWLSILGQKFFRDETTRKLGFQDLLQVMHEFTSRKAIIENESIVKIISDKTEERAYEVVYSEQKLDNMLALVIAQLKAIDENPRSNFPILSLTTINSKDMEYAKLEDKYYKIARTTLNYHSHYFTYNQTIGMALIGIILETPAHKNILYLAHLLTGIDISKISPKTKGLQNKQNLSLRAFISEASEEDIDYFLKILFLSSSKTLLKEIILRNYDKFFEALSINQDSTIELEIIPGIMNIRLRFAYNPESKSLTFSTPEDYQHVSSGESESEQKFLAMQGDNKAQITLDRHDLSRIKFSPYDKYHTLAKDLARSYSSSIRRSLMPLFTISFLYELYKKHNTENEVDPSEYIIDSTKDLACMLSLLTFLFIVTRPGIISDVGKSIEGRHTEMREQLEDNIIDIKTTIATATTRLTESLQTPNNAPAKEVA